MVLGTLLSDTQWQRPCPAPRGARTRAPRGLHAAKELKEQLLPTRAQPPFFLPQEPQREPQPATPCLLSSRAGVLRGPYIPLQQQVGTQTSLSNSNSKGGIGHGPVSPKHPKLNGQSVRSGSSSAAQSATEQQALRSPQQTAGLPPASERARTQGQ